jgi:hypothetical protein
MVYIRSQRKQPNATKEEGMPAILTVVGLVVLAVLVFILLKMRRSDLVGEFMEKRRSNSKIVSRAEYVEGVAKIPVALSLTSDTVYYENPDLQASFDLNRIDEVEYSDDLATGRHHDLNACVLRLRSHGATFEFLMDKPECEKWRGVLPPRKLGSGQTATAV